MTRAEPASPFRFIADVTLGALGLRHIIVNEAHSFLDWLIDLNVSRAESETQQSLERLASTELS